MFCQVACPVLVPLLIDTVLFMFKVSDANRFTTVYLIIS